MSDLEVEADRQEMEESGELDFIRAHAAAATAPAAPVPPAAADTVEDEPVVEEVEVEEAPVVEETADEALTAEEEETLYLELDDATQALIDTKYGGDINKALAALPEAQSVIGRQGNELGELRKQIEDGLNGIRRDLVASQPYPDLPDEFAEPAEAAMQYRAIAELAFEREDVDTFGSIVDAWIDVDPLGGNTYRDLKILQLQTALQQAPAPAPLQGNPEQVISEGVAKVQEEFPQSTTPEFQAAMAEELQKFPSLKGLLWGEIPGTTPEQRVTALRETVMRVASRQTGETEEIARKRVAVKRSEAARQARVEAKVASGESARVAEPEVEGRKVPLGETGRSLDIDRLNAMLPEADRI